MGTWEKIIKTYLEDRTDVSEIATNGTTSIFLRQKGKRVEVKDVFMNMQHYNEDTKELILKINKKADPDKSEFLEEGTLYLSDGTVARCHIVLPPACLYPTVTIARKTADLTTLDNIYMSGSINEKMLRFLKAAVDMKLTIVLSGSTGAGKTTMLEALTKLWPDTVRVGVVEDAPELMLKQPNVFYLKSSVAKPGVGENDVATLQWCVAQLNRMRVDLIIIGETRGPEFAGFITAANSGNEGSLTTIHAQDPAMALQKMNTFMNMAHAMPQRVINQNIASSVDIIIQLTKTVDGKYRTTHISEVTTQLSNSDTATIATSPLFEYDSVTDTWTSKTPTSLLTKKLREHGYDNEYRKLSYDSKEEYNNAISRPNIFATRRY